MSTQSETILLKNVELLLKRANTIIEHQEEITKLKGESFNLFSILGVESNENATHSAFLGELLNPAGSHLMGNLFLKLFLEHIEFTGNFNLNKATLKLEKNVGVRNSELIEGGRIDIYLSDSDENTISIENKIYASDQEKQIERYFNHNRGQNTVYYLNLFGEEASDESQGKLESGVDYHILSYREHIVAWLELCLKESAEQPILRESIRQYIILIKKLTHTMSTEFDQKLVKEILFHYEAAEVINSRFSSIREEIGESIREEVASRLRTSANYSVELGKRSKFKYCQIWMTPKIEGLNTGEKGKETTYLGMESFNGKGHFDGQLFLGIILVGDNVKGDFKHEFHNWHDIKKLNDFEDIEVNFSKAELLRKLADSEDFRTRFVNNLVEEAMAYMNEKYDKIKNGLIKN